MRTDLALQRAFLVLCILVLPLLLFYLHSHDMLINAVQKAAEIEVLHKRSVEDKKPKAKAKLILSWTNFFWGSFVERLLKWRFTRCEHRCDVTENRTLASKADAILFHAYNTRPDNLPPTETRHFRQVYAVYDHESPLKTPQRFMQYFFNATIDYRPESDYFAPYDKLVPTFDVSKRWTDAQVEAAVARKSRLVFALVSNCKDKSGRKEYIEELSKYIDITQKGACFSQNHSRCGLDCVQELEKEHFFVLSFENAVCDHYVTEKFWRMKRLVVPIVLKRSVVQPHAPQDSFIAADDFKSPSDLAEFLIDVSLDRKRYKRYFSWTQHYAKAFADPVTEALCNFCRDLHFPKLRERRAHDDFQTIWQADKQCYEQHIRNLLRTS